MSPRRFKWLLGAICDDGIINKGLNVMIVVNILADIAQWWPFSNMATMAGEYILPLTRWIIPNSGCHYHYMLYATKISTIKEWKWFLLLTYGQILLKGSRFVNVHTFPTNPLDYNIGNHVIWPLMHWLNWLIGLCHLTILICWISLGLMKVVFEHKMHIGMS